MTAAPFSEVIRYENIWVFSLLANSRCQRWPMDGDAKQYQE